LTFVFFTLIFIPNIPTCYINWNTLLLSDARISFDDDLRRLATSPVEKRLSQHISGGSVNAVIMYSYSTLHVISREYPSWACWGGFPLPSLHFLAHSTFFTWGCFG